MTVTVMQGTVVAQGGGGGGAAAPQAPATTPQAPGSQAKSLPGKAQPGQSQPQTAKEIRDQLRDQIRQSVRDGGQPQIIIPNDFTNAVPRGAVDISEALFVSIAAMVILTPLARALARRSDAKIRAFEDSSRNMSPQIEQLQSSIDAMAIELERISESQRFQAKLLAGKEAEPARVNP